MSENKLFLVRHTFTDNSSIGTWYLNKPNGMRLCDNIEDKDRGLLQSMPLDEIKKIKQYGITAIPYGVYAIEKYMSPRLKKEVYHLLNVPGFDGILIHSANMASELLGCLAPGTYVEGKKDFVSNSRNMTKYLNGIIEKFEIKTIEIVKAGTF